MLGPSIFLAYQRFGQLSLNIKLTRNKLVFVWYQFNGNTAAGKPVAFKLMIDELEVKTARSKTTNANAYYNFLSDKYF